MFCSGCGRHNLDVAVYCAFCGAELLKPENVTGLDRSTKVPDVRTKGDRKRAATPATGRPHRGRLIWLCCAGIAIVLGAILVWGS